MTLTPRRLDALLKAFTAANPRYLTVSGSLAMCDTASGAFADMLRGHGIGHTVWYATDRKTPLPMPHVAWAGRPLHQICHFVVQIQDGLVYDWTIRQFDQQAESPGVYSLEQLRQDWATVLPMRKSLDAIGCRYLPEPSLTIRRLA